MVIGILVILTVILLLIMIGAIWGINVAMARMVGDKHRALEEILATGQAPAAWSRRYAARLARLRGASADSAELKSMQARAVADYVGRLDKLIRYAETTSLIVGDGTREMLLEKLAAARASWLADGAA
ncbi:MAG: hypothetical protein QG637_1502 [Chloroflexota bacterium]|nr:hypothetical protein [Chloroflexota bacterium]